MQTLEEMDMEYRELAEESGIVHWRRVPALNTNPTFIDDLADAVLQVLVSFLCVDLYVESFPDVLETQGTLAEDMNCPLASIVRRSRFC